MSGVSFPTQTERKEIPALRIPVFQFALVKTAGNAGRPYLNSPGYNEETTWKDFNTFLPAPWASWVPYCPWSLLSPSQFNLVPGSMYGDGVSAWVTPRLRAEMSPSTWFPRRCSQRRRRPEWTGQYRKCSSEMKHMGLGGRHDASPFLLLAIKRGLVNVLFLRGQYSEFV